MAGKAFVSIAKLFMNGRSQAVRLPAECRFDADEVTIRKLGDTVIISPKTNRWDEILQERRFQWTNVFRILGSWNMRNGKPIAPNDTLITAHARSIGATLVTNNIQEFNRVESLQVESWI